MTQVEPLAQELPHAECAPPKKILSSMNRVHILNYIMCSVTKFKLVLFQLSSVPLKKKKRKEKKKTQPRIDLQGDPAE